jgi:hypothetical protein
VTPKTRCPLTVLTVPTLIGAEKVASVGTVSEQSFRELGTGVAGIRADHTGGGACGAPVHVPDPTLVSVQPGPACPVNFSNSTCSPEMLEYLTQT